MGLSQKAVPEPQAILQAWMPFKEVLGVTSVHSEQDYGQARATIEVLLDEIGDNENHPLARCSTIWPTKSQPMKMYTTPSRSPSRKSCCAS